MLATGGGLDPLLEVFNQAGRRIKRCDNTPLGADSRLSLRARAGQVLYVRAAAADQTDGDYSLSVASLPTDDAGNDLESAALSRLLRNGKRWRSGRINYADDVDVYRITAPRDGTLTVRLRAADGSTLDGYLQIADADGSILASNDDAPGTLDSEAACTVVAGQQYFLIASGMAGSTGRYRLGAVVQAPPPPQPQPMVALDASSQDPAWPEDVAPGPSVLVKLMATGGQRELRITGTDGADQISVAAVDGGVRVSAAGRSWTFADVTSLRAYLFDGDDVLRLIDGLDLPALVWAGDGHDEVFAASKGGLDAHGGAGDDLLVSLNSAADHLDGGAGVDSFWGDTTDTAVDLSDLERSVASLHRIDSFYQPYSSNPASPNYIPLALTGQELGDPAADYAYGDLSEMDLFNNGPQYTDIAQGLLGDCYFLASLASLAQADPYRARQLIAPLGDGTYAVRFYRDSQEVYLRLDADLPLYNPYYLAYAQPSLTGEIWVPLLEKAYAWFRYGRNSYASIEGGWMNEVLPQLTGLDAGYRSPKSLSAAALFDLIDSALSAGQSVTAGSYYSASGPVVGGHAYMVQSVQRIGEDGYVTLYNPWGVDGRTWDPDPNDGLIRLSIQQVRDNFSRIVTAQV
jgi:hypothetical protein